MNAQDRNVPALRFPAFEDEWRETKLVNIASRVISKNRTNDVSYVLTNSATRGIVSQQDYFDKDIANQNNLEGYYIVEKNDFVYNPRISANAPVGPIKRNNLAKGLMSPLYSVFRFNEKNLDYFEHYFESVHWHKYLKGIANYGARHDRMNITVEDFFAMPFLLPSEEEKQKIAAFLTTVDEKIQQLARKKELLEQYKKGVMQKIFNQAIRFKDDNGNDFADWEEKKLGEVITNKSEKYNPEKEKTNYKCIELEHLASETPSLLGYVDSNNSGSIKNKFDKDDVLFGKLRPYLKKYLQAPFDGVCSSEIWVLKGKDILNTYLFRLVQTDEFISLANQSTGSKMPRADWNVISASLFAIPSKPEQQKIASFLSAIDDKINLVNQKLGKTKQYKKSLLQKMFI